VNKLSDRYSVKDGSGLRSRRWRGMVAAGAVLAVPLAAGIAAVPASAAGAAAAGPVGSIRGVADQTGAALARTVQAPAASGARLWAARYNGPGSGADAAMKVAVSSTGGRVFVTGSSYGGSSTGDDYATAAYNTATGRQLWVARYNRTTGDSARAVAVSPDGRKVYVTGDFDTVAYDAATGARLWVSVYGAGGAVAVAVSPDGGTVYVAGSSAGTGVGPCGGIGFGTVAYNAATGARLWGARYCGPTGDHTYARALVVSPDGSTVYVTGTSDLSHSDSGDYATVAYNAVTGAQLWASLYNGPANNQDIANAVAVSPDGSTVYATGSSIGLTSGVPALAADYATIAYNAATGAQLWVRRYHGPGKGDDSASAVTVSPAGTVVVTGTSWGVTSNQDYATIAYSPVGTRLWVKRYNGPGNGTDAASSVVAPGTGKVYVTGTSWGGSSTRNDYATIAYSVFTGATLWVQRYDGPAGSGDYASSVAARAGRVFVTGASYGINSGLDYATVAYNG
jgi:outer membrane protein assembly factor BamB